MERAALSAAPPLVRNIMTSKLRAVAENRFAALTRREETAMSAVEADLRATQEKTARLRALRLDTQAQAIAENSAKLKVRRKQAATQAD